MASNTTLNDLKCYICGEIYTNPVVISQCGHSFDRQCIIRYNYCPIRDCNIPLSEYSLLENDNIKELIHDYKQSIGNIYEIFLLDTSTSMWYSDSFTGLFGTGRFYLAIQFLNEIFQRRWNSTTYQISLITFDKHPEEHFSFQTIRQHHSEILEKLTPTGSPTCLFDAIKFSLEKFEKLNQILNRSTTRSIYILTDGGDNFSSTGNEKHYIKFIKEYSKKLNILGNIILVGDKNIFHTKNLCENIDYQFHHFNSDNILEFVRSFLLSSNLY
ncbi:unnamed protein product [Rotaria sordida]|uniref:VWFA domain-containing protein n=1 Tax=Rotaria sordida TaxID=392033 RepID=A0A813T381_9BILA|nr:unnamed protein product [Rotaria sordida]CAF0818384.1 unnamed protein product [Rotaria sordida]CAF0832328.1 unnamed protein product [Rotaria sordida]CAF3715978.1 unnamed protein product [Rotaria sordida]